jgi:hypothetical protein
MRGDASNVFVVGYVNRPNRTDPRSRVGRQPRPAALSNNIEISITYEFAFLFGMAHLP